MPYNEDLQHVYVHAHNFKLKTGYQEPIYSLAYNPKSLPMPWYKLAR